MPSYLPKSDFKLAQTCPTMLFYEAMVYGVEKDDPQTKDKWKSLLLQCCKLDTLSMVMVWRRWNQIITRKPAYLPWNESNATVVACSAWLSATP